MDRRRGLAKRHTGISIQISLVWWVTAAASVTETRCGWKLAVPGDGRGLHHRFRIVRINLGLSDPTAVV